jgi:tetratricopeptide (TPR) repeat protein
MLRAALQLSPTNALYALKMRLTRIEAGQQDLMLQAARQELKAHPSAGDWLLTAAAVQLRKGKISEAVNYLKQAQNNVDPNMFNAVLEDQAFSRYSNLKELSVFFSKTKKSS